MPIDNSRFSPGLSKEEFEKIVYAVSGQAYIMHNEIGRFCNEVNYKHKLAHLCGKLFDQVELEVPIELTHKEFTKTLFADFVVNRSSLFELKTTREIVNEHISQTLDYLFLSELHYGELINFRPLEVKRKPVMTSLTFETRRQFNWHDINISDISARGLELRHILQELLADWGAFLQPTLYTEVITFFLGGKNRVEKTIPLHSDGIQMGHQKVRMINDSEAFRITSYTGALQSNRTHMHRFFKCTPLKSIYWLNLDRHEVTFEQIQ